MTAVMTKRRPVTMRRSHPKPERQRNDREERYYVTAEISALLDELASRRNQSKSDYVRQIIQRQVRVDLAELEASQHTGAAPADALEEWATGLRRKLDEIVAELQRPPVPPKGR